MQGGVRRLWEGHLLQVVACNETNRKALFFGFKAYKKEQQTNECR